MDKKIPLSSHRTNVKKRTNSYNFVRITPVHALYYPRSTDPICVTIALL